MSNASSNSSVIAQITGSFMNFK